MPAQGPRRVPGHGRGPRGPRAYAPRRAAGQRVARRRRCSSPTRPGACPRAVTRVKRLNSRRAAILAVAMLAIAPATAGASTHGHRAAHWILSPARSHGAGHNELLGVAYAGITAWAVGDFYDGRSDRTLVERYAG